MLPDGAIFCGECGRAVNTASSRRTVAPEPVDRGTPPPLQQPDPHGRRPDPAAEAWLPESTLDPATRAWLTGADRRRNEPVAPVPVQTPDSFAPRSAPTHVHGAGSGLGEWTGAPDSADAADPVDAVDSVQASAPAEPPLDPDAFPAEPALAEDDPEITRVAPRADAPPVVPSAAAPSPVAPAPAPPPAPAPAPADLAPAAPAESAVPFWAAPEEPAAAPAPSAPSWWIGRATDEPAEEAAPDTDDSASTDEAAAAPADGAATADDAVAAPTEAPSPTDSAAPGAPAAPEAPEAPRAGDTVAVEPLIDRRPPRPTPLVQPGSQPTTCHVCGSRLEPDDIFCNECGAVRPAVTAAFTGPVMPLPIARPDWAAQDDVVADDEIVDEIADDDEDDEVAEHLDEIVADEVADSVMSDAPADAPSVDSSVDEPSVPASPTAPSSVPAPDESGPVLSATPMVPTAAPLPPIPGAATPELPQPAEDAAPSSSDADESAQLDEDVDETRIVTKTPTRAPFVLHFSTGERLGVHGTGLLGRLPRPEPGERFDDLLTIHDPGKSVSKTHLELGRDGDDLWVSDRFSGNGSVIRHIDGSIRRCEPGRRYRVERGARVDVGEQFFLVQ
ncbi:hypothetical protein [Curtobacterium sp. PhB130]|uniref:hypothetical protein n=1 Tax=Curtobacterium sp. PhB130 TaxID=2485178 RepID=UPI000F4C2E53|nr:hypothetical protein [Curtobacterium sp. PhB130]